MIKTIKNLLKRKHRHVWKEEIRHNEEHHMLWYLRRCECGIVEMRNAGGTGDGKWHPFTDKFKFCWEKEWFDSARKVIFKEGVIKNA